jgi:glucose 1-dehydrogenase
MLPDQVVLILNDRIAQVGPAAQIKIPDGARVIDLSKETVLPGLIDPHTHVFKNPKPGMSRETSTLIAIQNTEATETLERQISELGSQSIGVAADVSKCADLQKLVDAAVERFGRLDIMVNNAGIETRTSVLDTSEAQYDKVMAINLKSAFFGTQLAARQMIKQGSGGRIINITSVHEDWPMPGNTAYCLAKGGMRMLTRTAGLELASHKILVVGVGPGAVATPINLSTMNDPGKLAQLDAAIPLGRMARPEEIASVVGFLAGDGASYLTATTIFADGGIMHSSVGL